MNASTLPEFLPLTGVYEPSAVQQLADGRFLIIEDDKKHPFTLLTLSLDGRISSIEPQIVGGDSAAQKLNDLEGLTLDRLGHFYAVTSHSRNRDGDNQSSRNKLVRFRVEADQVTDARVIKGLKSALLAAHPVLAKAARIRDVKDEGGFNIEALAISIDQQRLMISFRSPLHDQRAVIASVENPVEAFESAAKPQVSPSLITLDLDGDGIRGMCHVPALKGYLITAGPASSASVQFRLWFWSGEAVDAARRVRVSGLVGFEHAEGVCPAVIAGQQRILIVSDDGNRSQARGARYLLLDPAQLLIED